MVFGEIVNGGDSLLSLSLASLVLHGREGSGIFIYITISVWILTPSLFSKLFIPGNTILIVWL